MGMRRPPSGDRPPGSDVSLREADWFETQYPTLAEFASCTVWEDGGARETGTILLLVDEGRWKVCLNDRALSRSAWVSGDSPCGAFGNAEDGLREERLDWRRRREGGPPGRGGRRSS